MLLVICTLTNTILGQFLRRDDNNNIVFLGPNGSGKATDFTAHVERVV